MAVILRYFNEFGSFRADLRKVVEDVHVRYLMMSSCHFSVVSLFR